MTDVGLSMDIVWNGGNDLTRGMLQSAVLIAPSEHQSQLIAGGHRDSNASECSGAVLAVFRWASCCSQ